MYIVKDDGKKTAFICLIQAESYAKFLRKQGREPKIVKTEWWDETVPFGSMPW